MDFFFCWPLLGSTISANARRPFQLAPSSRKSHLGFTNSTQHGTLPSRGAWGRRGAPPCVLAGRSGQARTIPPGLHKPLSFCQATSHHLDLDFPNGKSISLEKMETAPGNHAFFAIKALSGGKGALMEDSQPEFQRWLSPSLLTTP